MTRRALLPLAALVLSVLIPAHRSPALPPLDEITQFHRNLALIEALVENSVRLVQDNDPLARAEACAQVGKRFLTEVQEAAAHREGNRLAELGQHLHKLLETGIIPNLQAARQQIPEGSTAEAKLLEVTAAARELVEQFRTALQTAAERTQPGELREALDELLRKQAELPPSFPGHIPAAESAR